MYIPIKLMNVPVLASLVVETQLCSFWATHGEVIAIALHTYKGTLLQSNRWDLVLKLQAGKPLSATPFSTFWTLKSWRPGLAQIKPAPNAS